MVLMSMQERLQVTFNRLSEYHFEKEYLWWEKGTHDLDKSEIWMILSLQNCFTLHQVWLLHNLWVSITVPAGYINMFLI